MSAIERIKREQREHDEAIRGARASKRDRLRAYEESPSRAKRIMEEQGAVEMVLKDLETDPTDAVPDKDDGPVATHANAPEAERGIESSDSAEDVIHLSAYAAKRLTEFIDEAKTLDRAASLVMDPSFEEIVGVDRATATHVIREAAARVREQDEQSARNESAAYYKRMTGGDGATDSPHYDYESRFNHTLTNIQSVLEAAGLLEYVEINQELLGRAIIAYFDDIDRIKAYQDISLANCPKIYAYEAYWCLRYRPIQIVNTAIPENYLSVNEWAFTLIAMLKLMSYEGIDYAVCMDRVKPFLSLLFYNVRFRTYTPQTLEQAFTAFCTACNLFTTGK